MKDQLIFDVTDANTIADSDSVGAYLRSSDGTLITHSTVGGKEALDVSIADGVNVEVDLSHLDDSVRLGNGTDFFTSTSENGDISLDVHISNSDLDIRDLAFATDSVDVSGSEVSLDAATLAALETVTVEQGTSPWVIGDGGGSLTVDAVDLDIRDLAFATDSVDVSGSTILGITNDVSIDDGGNSITVDAVDLDIRDLSAAQDSVQSNLFDGAGTALTSTLVGADQSLDVNITQSVDPATSNTAIATGATTLTAGNTAQDIIASPLANRKEVYVYNLSNKKVYIGETGVSSSDGFPVSPGSYLQLKAGAAVDIEYVGQTTGQEIRTLELS